MARAEAKKTVRLSYICKSCGAEGTTSTANGDINECPRCGSRRTAQLSQFGSTACKALWRCDACKEPFEYFKPI